MVFGILIYLLVVSSKSEIYQKAGWRYLIFGFMLLVFASIIDVTDNYEYLNRYVVVGDTPVQAFFEKVVGYLGGFSMLAVGFYMWLPQIGRLEQTRQELLSVQKALRRANTTLEKEVQERTHELEIEKGALEERVGERTAELEKLKISLEKTVAERTNELKQNIIELEQLNKAMTNRELRMVELKKRIVYFEDKYPEEKQT